MQSQDFNILAGMGDMSGGTLLLVNLSSCERGL